MLLICGFSSGQVSKPDIEVLRTYYRNDPSSGLLDETITLFSLPPERAAERHDMLTRLCKEGEFPRWANLVANELASKPSNGQVILDFHESIILWLEKSDPRDLNEMNLSWVTHGALYFFGGHGNSLLPVLFNGDWRKQAAEREAYEKGSMERAERKYRLARRLAVALIGLRSTAEEGFRLLSATGGMGLTGEEMDAAARNALAVTSDRLLNPQDGDRSFFLRHKSGGSGGHKLGSHSSARWLSARLATEPADQVIPLSWIQELGQIDPDRARLAAALREKCGWARLEGLWPRDWESIENLGPVTAMLFREIFHRSAAGPGSEPFFINKLGAFPTIRSGHSPFDNAPVMLLIRGALLAAATSDEPTRESLCRLVGRIVYGGDVSPDDTFDPEGAINGGGGFTMITSFLDWPSDDRAASLRLLATLHRLRIPVGASHYAVNPMFYDKPPLTFEDADRLLEGAGWLTDAHDWNPARVISLELRYDPEKRKRLMAKETLIGRVVVDHQGFDIRGFTARLKERKNGRFGALLFASQLVPESERDALILSAFSEMEEGWVNNPSSPPPPFSLITDMMDPESAAELPAFLRRR